MRETDPIKILRWAAKQYDLGYTPTCSVSMSGEEVHYLDAEDALDKLLLRLKESDSE